MSKTTETAVDQVNLLDETLHDIVETLEKALKPKVFYHPDHQQMTEDALKVGQDRSCSGSSKKVGGQPASHALADTRDR